MKRNMWDFLDSFTPLGCIVAMLAAAASLSIVISEIARALR